VDPITETNKDRFLWGIFLGWVPFLFFVLPFASAFRGISSTKATGVAAVAGGLGEAFATLGFVCFLTAQISAIVLLSRSLAKGRGLKNVLAIISIVVCVFTLLIVVGGVWLVFASRHP
jgi:hypothetical protein